MSGTMIACLVLAAAMPEDLPKRGVCVFLGAPDAAQIIETAKRSDLLIYVQSPNAKEVQALQVAAEQAGSLNRRLCVEHGPYDRLQLADNLADAVVALSDTVKAAPETEVLRVLRPGASARLADKALTKPVPHGVDSWSHPYHGPDNNPQSTDQLARAPYLTQFLARPMFSSQPEVTVAAGGRLFKAFGHMAFRDYQNDAINTLIAMSAYNGEILWQRRLKPGFMIHRNTMIATPEVLYLADDESCKVIDATTGEVKGEIAPPAEEAGGTVWKWLALEKGTLYALLGGTEVQAPVTPGTARGLGGWPWGMWPGYDYRQPETAWGHGKTFLAIDPKSKAIRWRHREDEFVDGRGVVMRNGRIYFFCPQKSLGCLDAATGDVVWRTKDAELLQAIGPHGRAQTYTIGFSTSTYLKAGDKALFFAGPQRSRLVCVSTADGRLLWQKEDGNLQLVLRDEGIVAAGKQGGTSALLDYDTGSVLASFLGRRACTRATGSIDSVFFRAAEGTLRYQPQTNTIQHIAPMRPGCHDGVIISDGHLYWGPWICGCNLSLFGVIALGPAGRYAGGVQPEEDGQVETCEAGQVEERAPAPGDWPVYRADSQRTAAVAATVPAETSLLWEYQPPAETIATAPVAADGLVLTGGTDGVVRALDATQGALRWSAYTGGALYLPPALGHGRAFAGSTDGRVYALESASGRLLWRFRAAPIERKTPLYGTLASTWPVAGGVLVDGATVYAAAGIAHYDGVHVYALDAATGRVKWHNGSSGCLDAALNTGVSVMGPPALRERRLEFSGGNAYPSAQYDLVTGKCLNTPSGRVATSARTFFYPREEWRFLLDQIQTATFPTEKGAVVVVRGGIGRLRPAVSLRGALPAERRPAVDAAWPTTNPADYLWRTGPLFGAYRALACTENALLAAGSAITGDRTEWSIVAIGLADGSRLWSHRLPAAPVAWGLAVDCAGRTFVSLEDGRVLAFAARPPV
jgi:outer membrane protein assembly factor BamB